MSYASECLARGRTMWNDMLKGVRERRGRRWVLVLPVAFFGSLLLCLLFLPAILIGDPFSFFLFFLFWYTFVALATVAAPAGKRLVAVLFASLGLLFCWWTIRLPPDPDPDASSPVMVLAGTLGGAGLAVALAFLRVHFRWLLVLPAYLLGFDGLFAAILLVASLMASLLETASTSYLTEQMIIGSMWTIVLLIPVANGIFLATRMAPSHRRWVAAGAILFTLLMLGAACYSGGF